jgi:hypothetical protein
LLPLFGFLPTTLLQKPPDHSSGKPERSKRFATYSASLVFLALKYF